MTDRHDPDTESSSFARAGLLAGSFSALCSGGMIYAVHRCAGIVPSSEITFLRALTATLFLLPFALRHKVIFFSKVGAVVWFRSMVGAVSILALAWNLQHTTVGFAYTLFNLAPFMVVLFGAWLGHEQISRSRFLTIGLVVLASVAFWHASRFEAGIKVWLVGIIGMSAAAGAYVLLKSIPKHFSTFHITWALSVATLPVALAFKNGPWLVPSGRGAVYVVLICGLSLTSNVLANVSFRILPLSMATALVPSAIIWGVLLDLTDNDLPKFQGVVGCLLYLLALFHMVSLAQKDNRRAA